MNVCSLLPRRTMRRDAAARREALLEAAAVCFAESGYGVALEEIAERAGVGRGTLYRNFRDRMALALAIFEREVDRLAERLAGPPLPLREALAGIVRNGMRTTSLFARIAAEMNPSGDDLAAFEALGGRVEAIVAPLVAHAHAAGELRGDVTPYQVVLAIRMVSGLLLKRQDPARVDATIEDAIDLLLTGMRPQTL